MTGGVSNWDAVFVVQPNVTARDSQSNCQSDCQSTVRYASWSAHQERREDDEFIRRRETRPYGCSDALSAIINPGCLKFGPNSAEFHLSTRVNEVIENPERIKSLRLHSSHSKAAPGCIDCPLLLLRGDKRCF